MSSQTASPLLDRLREIVGAAHVLTEPADQAPFLVGPRRQYPGQSLAVVQPADTPSVSAVVRACIDARTPFVPQGGNTGLCGGASPDASGRSVVISLSRMRRVRDIDPTGNTITVDAGCTLAEVQAAAQSCGRLFPMSIGSEGSCQIGGNISTNAGGTTVLRYGTMRQLVLGLEVVLPDGQVMDELYRLYKNNMGYDVKQFFVGAEGTLGVITGAVLKLSPAPARSATAMVGLSSIPCALDLLAHLRDRVGERLTNYELLSSEAMDEILKLPGLAHPMSGPCRHYQIVEITDAGHGVAPVEVLQSALADALERGLIEDAVVATSERQAKRIWEIRHRIGEAYRSFGSPIYHDVAVPLAEIARFVELAAAFVQTKYPLARAIAAGHIGDGNIHLNVHFPRNHFADEGAYQSTRKAVNRGIYAIAAQLRGSISAEHGIGQSLASLLPDYRSDAALCVMRALKRGLDPLNLSNPGKVLATVAS